MEENTPNPLAPWDHAAQQRIRERAYHLWERDGRPEGRDSYYWDEAEILTRMELAPHAGEVDLQDGVPPTDKVDEASLQENLGEFPGRFTDQGERQQTPSARKRTPT